MTRRISFLFVIVMAMVATTAQAQTGAPFRVYLTFEDGPTRAYTPHLLDILAQYDAHATFFPNGYQIAGNEDIIRRMIAEGHAIGNHLWEEPGFYAGSDPELVMAAYQRTEDALRAALTPDLLAIYDAQPRIFRQPGGGGTPYPDANVYNYNWHVDSNDCGWLLDEDDPLTLDERVIHNVLREHNDDTLRYNVYAFGDGAVVVFHDINRVTGRVLPLIMDELSAAGATFHALPRPWDAPGTMPTILGTPPSQTSPGVPGFTLTGTLVDFAWAREAPTTDSSIVIQSIPRGEAVTIIGRVPYWYQVEYSGQTAWIYAVNLDVRGPIPNLPLVQ